MVRRYSENKMDDNCLTPYQKHVKQASARGESMKDIVSSWRAMVGKQPWMKPMDQLKLKGGGKKRNAEGKLVIKRKAKPYTVSDAPTRIKSRADRMANNVTIVKSRAARKK